MKKRTFVKNAFILTVTSLLLRGVGIFLRVYIAGQIGAEGMGLHTLIFTVYTFASAVATAGLSLAVTRLVSEDFAGGGKAAITAILKKALPLSMALGTAAMLAMFFLADTAAQYWLCDARAALSLRILSLGLPFMALSACFKGYFMARRNAKTPSDSQLIEQVVRILAVVCLLKPAAGHSLAYACGAIVLGNAVSEVFACIYLAVGYKADTHAMTYTGTPGKRILPRLTGVLLPVAFTGHMNTALHMVENLLVPQALTRFSANASLALSQFGMLKGMALPALFFPASFLSAMSSLLVPEMSEYGARNQKKSITRTAEFTLRTTFVSAVLIAGIFAVYPEEIAHLLYKDEEVGFFLAALAPIVPFMYLESIATGLLHGLGQQIATLKYNLANAGIRIAAVLFFVPKYGIRGFLAIMILSNLYTSIACLHRLFRIANLHIRWRRWVIAPTSSCVLALLACYVYNQYGAGLLHTIGGMAMFVCIFSLLACITGAVAPADIARFHSVLHPQKEKQ